MKTLARYLAEYIDQELTLFMKDSDKLQDVIKRGIEAYQSTENCTITITEQTQQQVDLLDAAREIVE